MNTFTDWFILFGCSESLVNNNYHPQYHPHTRIWCFPVSKGTRNSSRRWLWNQSLGCNRSISKPVGDVTVTQLSIGILLYPPMGRKILFCLCQYFQGQAFSRKKLSVTIGNTLCAIIIDKLPVCGHFSELHWHLPSCCFPSDFLLLNPFLWNTFDEVSSLLNTSAANNQPQSAHLLETTKISF